MRAHHKLQTTTGEIVTGDVFETEDEMEDFLEPDSILSTFTQFASYRIPVDGTPRSFNPAHIVWIELYEVPDEESVVD